MRHLNSTQKSKFKQICHFAGDQIISRTFLPNLVLHESSETPFYDMPGFNDNRNASIEIANSFFVHQILEAAETIKIIVLSEYASFKTSDKIRFPTLLRNLVALIKNPAKFRGGMAIISSIVPVGRSHDDIIGSNTYFLQEELLPDIKNLFIGEEEVIRGATEIVENWLESYTGNYYEAEYFSYFLSPSVDGPLLEEPRLVDNKKFLQDVIWNRLQYVPIETGDFGLPMSPNATFQLAQTGLCISSNLYTQLQTFATDLENYMLNKLLEGTETDISHISELWKNLTDSAFAFDNEELLVSLQNLLYEVKNLQTPFVDDTLQKIEDTLTFVQFILLVNADFQFQSFFNLNSLNEIEPNLIRSVHSQARTFQVAVNTQMQLFARELEEHILNQLLSVIYGDEEDITHITELLTNLTNSDFSFNNEEPIIFLQKLYSEIDNLEIPLLKATQQKVYGMLSFVQFILLVNANFEFDLYFNINDLQNVKANLIDIFDLRAKELLAAATFSLTRESRIIADLFLTPVRSSNDISEKESLASSKAANVRTAFEQIRLKEETTGMKVSELLVFYLSQYDRLRGCCGCSRIPELDVISVLEILNPPWFTQNWTAVGISALQKPLENERDLTIFLRALFKDLSQPNVQTGPVAEIFTWWNLVEKQLNGSNFRDFYRIIYTKGFTSGEIFKENEVEEFVFDVPEGKSRIEFLLNFMLSDVYNCPSSSEIIFRGPIISFDRLADCISKQQRTTIVLLATHKIYANSKITGRNINSDNNINVILMAPEIIVSRNSEIDLSGTAGQLGVNGKPAGTQYSLFEKISTTDASIPWRITLPNLTGGTGVDGKVGDTGDRGKDGSNNWSANSNDCAAWAGGYIQIRNYVNTCNVDTNTYCHAGNNGVMIKITGTSGTNGVTGKTGGNGSCGGGGGQSYSVDANNFHLPKVATNGSQGKNGVGGAGGAGGLGGLAGNTRFVVVDDYYSPGNRYCAQLHHMSEPSSVRSSSGASGSAGQSCTTVVPVKSVNRNSVTNHFASFKAALSSLATNEFMSSQASSLVKLLGSAQPL